MTESAVLDKDLITFPTGSTTPQRLDLLLRRLPVELDLIDRQGRLAWFNRGFNNGSGNGLDSGISADQSVRSGRRILSRTADQLGLPATDLFPHLDQSSLRETLADLRAGGTDTHRVQQSEDGRVICTELHALRDAEGRYLGASVCTQDVTDLRSLRGSRIPEQDEILRSGPSGLGSPDPAGAGAARTGSSTETAGAAGTRRDGEPRIEDGALVSPTGRIGIQTLYALLNALPYEIGYCDETDIFRWYTEDGHRIFLRHQSSVGQYVVDLHPPRIRGAVEALLEAFRRGIRDHFEFWIELRGRMVAITFLALHDADGQYLGCFDLTGDVTQLRSEGSET